MDTVRLICGDARSELARLPGLSVHACVTSPSYYGLRDYGCAGQIGLEETPQEYVAHLVEVFRGVWRVLRDDGTLWLVLGDSYAAGGIGAAPSRKSTLQRHGADGRSPYLDALGPGCTRRPPVGIPAKSLLGIPWRVAFALQDDGWLLRQELIWAKPNPMPESVKDRCTRGHETVFMLAKGPSYFYDQQAIAEAPVGTNHHDKTGGRYAPHGQVPHTGSRNGQAPIRRNKRSVWTVSSQPFSARSLGVDTEHYAAFPPELVRPMVRAATSERGVCPRCGSPWRRVVERQPYERALTAHRGRSDWADGSGRNDGDLTRSGQEHNRYKAAHPDRILGWQPPCPCDAGAPVPATVLDPFCGSGTTGLVAAQEGRGFVGIDLNPAYIALSRARIATAQPALFTASEASQAAV